MTINNTTVANSLYGRSISGTSTSPFIDVFMPRDPTPQDTQYVIQQKWLNTTEGHFWELQNFTSLTGFVQANWVKIASSQHVETLTGNVGGAVSPIGNNINVVGDTTTINVLGSPGTATLLIETGDLVPTVFVEDVGAAAPLVSTINVLGGTGISTSGAGNTITISTTGAVAESFTTNSGVAIPVLGNLNILGAGTVTTSGAGSTVTITGLGTVFNYTNVTSAASPYTVLVTDHYISVDCSAGPVVLNFPNAPVFKQEWIVKDRTGNAAVNNISITTPGGTVTFDGITTYIANSNYQAVQLIANATPTYEVF